MRSDWINNVSIGHILEALTWENRLAVRLSMATGLRIGDVLAIRTARLKQRMTVKEEKTGKSRRIYIPTDLYYELSLVAGRFFVFEHRTDQNKHRTRQAVYKDIKRACKAFRYSVNVTPHTARKIYSVNQMKNKNIKQLQADLKHADVGVTMIYALADEITRRKYKDKSYLN